MIGDNHTLHPKYFTTAEAILPHLPLNTQKLIFGIGGESGSGKSVTALALQQRLNELGYPTLLLHQDDYFKFPPASNHQKRVEDINWVGFQEVHLALLSAHCQAFKNGQSLLQKPLVDYPNNQLLEESISLEGISILLIEGTYCLQIPELDFRIFMCRTYLQTLENRLARGRDVIDEFSNQVLEIEHQLISPFAANADLWIDENYQVQQNPALSTAR